MGDINLLKELIIIYGCTTISSLIFNELYFVRKTKKAYKKTRRKLKYKDLSSNCSNALNRHDILFKQTLKISRFTSFLPILQIKYTCKNILDDQKVYDARFEKDIDYINDEEIRIRREFLEKIKNSNIIPDDIQAKMKTEDYLPSELDYRKVLNCNKPKKLLKTLDTSDNKKDINQN